MNKLLLASILSAASFAASAQVSLPGTNRSFEEVVGLPGVRLLDPHTHRIAAGMTDAQIMSAGSQGAGLDDASLAQGTFGGPFHELVQWNSGRNGLAKTVLDRARQHSAEYPTAFWLERTKARFDEAAASRPGGREQALSVSSREIARLISDRRAEIKDSAQFVFMRQAAIAQASNGTAEIVFSAAGTGLATRMTTDYATGTYICAEAGFQQPISEHCYWLKTLRGKRVPKGIAATADVEQLVAMGAPTRASYSGTGGGSPLHLGLVIEPTGEKTRIGATPSMGGLTGSGNPTDVQTARPVSLVLAVYEQGRFRALRQFPLDGTGASEVVWKDCGRSAECVDPLLEVDGPQKSGATLPTDKAELERVKAALPPVLRTRSEVFRPLPASIPGSIFADPVTMAILGQAPTSEVAETLNRVRSTAPAGYGLQQELMTMTTLSMPNARTMPVDAVVLQRTEVVQAARDVIVPLMPVKAVRTNMPSETVGIYKVVPAMTSDWLKLRPSGADACATVGEKASCIRLAGLAGAADPLGVVQSRLQALSASAINSDTALDSPTRALVLAVEARRYPQPRVYEEGGVRIAELQPRSYVLIDIRSGLVFRPYTQSIASLVAPAPAAAVQAPAPVAGAGK